MPVLGAIVGDVVGSVHEWAGTKTKEFPLFMPASTFTDETILSIAVAEHLLDRTDCIDGFHRWFERYPGAGFGGSFVHWAFRRQREPYHSFGNGAAMRVAPIAHAFDTLDDVILHARANAAITHDHEEGVAGAEAVAACVFLARSGQSKDEIRRYVSGRFRYPLDQSLDDIRARHEFDSSCAGSVPPSIVAFLESDSFEDAVRNAISVGGDADTMAAIAGAIAEPFYGGVPEDIRAQTLARLDDRLRAIVERFCTAYPLGRRTR